MQKSDKSDIYRELYVQYCYLESDKQIFARIIEETNKAVSERTLYNYKKGWEKDGLKAEVRNAKAEYKANKSAARTGKIVEQRKKRETIVQHDPNKPLSSVLKHGEVITESIPEEESKSYYRGYRPDVAGMKPHDIIRKVCGEYVMGEYTLQFLLKVHGMSVTDFEKIISQEPELALMYENSRMQQRRIAFNQFNDNLIMWLKRSTDGSAEKRITIEYEIRPTQQPGVYMDVPIKKYETTTMKPPPPQMLSQIMAVLKEAQTIDKTEAQQFFQLAEGMTADQIQKEISELQAIRQARLNDRKQFNTTGN